MKRNAKPYKEASEKLSLKEKVGQLFMPAAFINDTEQEIRGLELLIQKHAIGSLCFFHSRASAATNFEGKKKIVYNKDSFQTLQGLISRYQKAATYPLLIAIDAEWGLAMRIENTPQYPYAITLGAIQGKNDLIFEVAKNIAIDCRKAGIHWNFAPVADINNNPNNPVIGYRSFGEDKKLVAQKALAFMKGTQSEGILTSAKHFPGHGDTATDSHVGLPIIDKPLNELITNELIPFNELIANGIDSIMVGHLAVPGLTDGKEIPASISKEIIKGILRKQLGFAGVVVSDALNMHSVSKLFTEKGALEWAAFDAGNDILCFAEQTASGIETILKRATQNQIEESFKRVWHLKEKAIFNFTETDMHEEGLMNPEVLNQKLALESLTVHKGNKAIINIFRNEDFIGIEISQKTDNQFFKLIKEKFSFNYISSWNNALSAIEEFTEATENVLLAVFPPKVKPQNNFDLSKEEILLMNQLIQHKNVVLYLFGNPYVLNFIKTENAKAVIIAYQDFTAFQEVAAKHFLGEVPSNGVLPVTIEKNI